MASQKLSKEEEKILRRYANGLPLIMEESQEKQWLKGSEILEFGTVDEIDGKKIDPEKLYLYNSPLQIAVNHYRRLKSAWLKNGESGLTDYLKSVRSTVEANKVVNI